MTKLLKFYSITFGCDPEFFFRSGESVVGADKVLPLSGLEYQPSTSEKKDGDYTSVGNMVSKVIIDGVQAELNPRPNTCRANLGNEISCIFQKLKKHMEDYKDIKIDFAQTIKLSNKDFELLSEDSKKFGCMPSKNSHDGGKEGRITVNPATYRYRSAGGHIHIGTGLGGSDSIRTVRGVLSQPERLVMMMDIIVGNTCVLLDRDRGNIERRKVYGRAGEFRTPPHGVEYRTLSNFWLRSYQLMSMVMGLTRQAVNIVANDMDKEFYALVDKTDIANAINNNDFTLALRNFKRIEKLLVSITPEDDNEVWTINKNTIEPFKHFYKKGLDYWFKEDPVSHWVNLHEGHDTGFESFLLLNVKRDMLLDNAS